MNQEKKAEIQALLKSAVPKNWKWSLAVRNYSTIVFTVREAPCADLGEHDGRHVEVNPYCLDKYFSESILPTAKKILAALNNKNHNRSDSQSDYFDIGHYVDFKIGSWDKKFRAK